MSIFSKMTAIADEIRAKTGKSNKLTLDEMASEIATIETGVELNFKVVGGTTQPTNPTENTIWVNTDKEITGWNFASEQPEDMKEGEVWFDVGTYSPVEFNALKKNNVTVCPTSAKQMVSGALKNVVAKTYQNREWVEWIEYLYNAGDECLDVTGGWSAKGWALNNHFTAEIPTITKGSSSMTLSLTTGQGAFSGVAHVGNDIDLTGKNKVVVLFSYVTATGDYNGEHESSVRLGIINRTSTYLKDAVAIDVKYVEAITLNDLTLQLDVSALSGKYDVVLILTNFSMSCSVTAEVQYVGIS